VREAAERDPRPGAEPARPAAGLRVRAALRRWPGPMPACWRCRRWRDRRRGQRSRCLRGGAGRRHERRCSPCAGLKKYFGHGDRPVRAVDDVSFDDRAGRGAGPGRRIGLAARARSAACCCADRADAGRSASRARRSRAAVGAAMRPCAAPADHLPGPLRERSTRADASATRSPRRWPRTACTRARRARRAHRRAARTLVGLRPSMRAAIRTSSPAASASASASPARWRSSPSSSSPTSRCRRSTSRSRRR
jgi:hypothetical protein